MGPAELQIERKLLVAHHIERDIELDRRGPPEALLELGWNDRQRTFASPQCRLLEEAETDVGLAKSGAVRVKDAAEALSDRSRALEAVLLEPGERDAGGLWLF